MEREPVLPLARKITLRCPPTVLLEPALNMKKSRVRESSLARELPWVGEAPPSVPAAAAASTPPRVVEKLLLRPAV